MFFKLSDPLKGTLYVFISAFMYATLPIFTKFAYLNGMEPASAIFYRYLFAFIILFFYLTVWKKGPIISTSPLVIAQGLMLITASLFYFHALQSLSASIGTIIFFTHPILVALLAISIYRERLSIKHGVGLLLALIGIILISGIFQGSLVLSSTGLILGVAASICYALFVLLSQINVAQTSPVSLAATFSLIGVIIIPIVFFRDFNFITSLTINQAFICLGMALLNTVLSITFLLKGVQKIGAARSALISNLEPVISVMLAMLLLQEIFSPLEAAGAVFVLISIFLAVSSHSNVADSVNTREHLKSKH